MVADDNESVWLYLTDLQGRIVADCWLLNLVPAPTREEIEQRRKDLRDSGSPPPAAINVVDSEAQLHGSLNDVRVEIVWTVDGDSVAAWIDGSLAGFIAAGDRRGYSAHLVVECPWGRPLDTELHRKLFDLV